MNAMAFRSSWGNTSLKLNWMSSKKSESKIGVPPTPVDFLFLRTPSRMASSSRELLAEESVASRRDQGW